MGKKSKIFYYVVLCVTIGIFILDLLPINFPFFKVSFAISLFLIGLLSIIRGYNLKIDSGLFLGYLLMFIGILNFIAYILQDYSQIWPYYLFSISISSFITAIYFKDKLQYKLCILFLLFGLISLLFVQNLIKLWLYIILMILWFVIYFTYNIIKKRRNN